MYVCGFVISLSIKELSKVNYPYFKKRTLEERLGATVRKHAENLEAVGIVLEDNFDSDFIFYSKEVAEVILKKCVEDLSEDLGKGATLEIKYQQMYLSVGD